MVSFSPSLNAHNATPKENASLNHMPRVGKQSERVGQPAAERFQQHKGGDDDERHAQYFFVGGMRVGVCVMMMFVMVMCHILCPRPSENPDSKFSDGLQYNDCKKITWAAKNLSTLPCG